MENIKPLNFIEACDLLGFSKSHMYKMTAEKKLPGVSKPNGKKLFFDQRQLLQWVSRNQTTRLQEHIGGNLFESPLNQ